MNADRDSRSTPSSAESDGTHTVNTRPSPRAVGGWTPEEWADQIRWYIDHCQDDLPDYKISMLEGDLILRRKGEDWQNDYIVLW